MSLWKRVTSLFLGNAHAALNELEDTKVMSDQLLREIDEKVSAARNALRDLMAQRELLEDDTEVALNKVKVWEEALINAESHPDAATLLPEVADNLQTANDDYSTKRDMLNDIIDQVKQVEADVKELTNDRTQVANTVRTLQTQAQVAKAQTKVAQATDSFDVSSEKNRLAEMQKRVREQQATATATRKMARQSSGEDVLAKLNATKKPSVDQLLEAAKSKRALG